jgi:dCTP deaminase
MLLSDRNLVDLRAAHPDLVSNLDLSAGAYHKHSPIQPSSLDLTIGNIYLPEVKQADEGSIAHPKGSHNLKPGQTAIVETWESLVMPRTHAAIGFPPSSVSSQGLLMTNPGHVDPGFNGKLSFTVINMGREEYHLERGKKVVTLLVFQVNNVEASYIERNPSSANRGVSRNDLSKLSSDFLDFERRAQVIVDKSEKTSRYWGIGVPLLGGILTLALSLGLSIWQTQSSTKNMVDELEKKIISNNNELDKKIIGLTNKLEYMKLEERVSNLEKNPQTK